MRLEKDEPVPAWLLCPDECGEYYCTIHHMHACDCECPPIDEWEIDPYSEGGLPLGNINRVYCS